MKALLTLISLLFFQSAFSQELSNIKKGDMNISGAKGKIVATTVTCPRIPGQIGCLAYGTIVEVMVTLNGCMDRLGGFFSKFQIIDGKGVLTFSAINIMNEASLSTRCVVAPTKSVLVPVPYEGEIKLVNANFMGTP